MPKREAASGRVAASNRVCAPTSNGPQNLERVTTPCIHNYCERTITVPETSLRQAALTEYGGEKEGLWRKKAALSFTSLQHVRHDQVEPHDIFSLSAFFTTSCDQTQAFTYYQTQRIILRHTQIVHRLLLSQNYITISKTCDHGYCMLGTNL